MKAITLTQPWATLVAIGEKSIETRSWQTHYRGPLAIHAGKNLSPIGGKAGLDRICAKEPFASALEGLELPFGVIVATCRLVGCIRTSTVLTDRAMVRELGGTFSEHEIAFGDYSAGRSAWILGDVSFVDPPYDEIRGKQGLWEVGVR